MKKNIIFSETGYLHSTEVPEISVYSSGNVYINVVDTFLVIVKSDTPFVNIYSTNSHNLLLAFGNKGRGPKEFIEPSVLNMEKPPATVFLHDFRRNTVARIELQNVLKDEIATPATGGNLLIHNSSNNHLITVPYLPETEFNIPSHSLPEIYRPAVLFNKAKKKIATAPLFLGEIDFFDLNGTLVSSSIFEPRNSYESELTKGSSSFRNIKQQIVELDNYRELIIALNSNIPVHELNSVKDFSKFQIFDWNGNPIKEFLLDNETRITSFAVDEINNRIYAYTPFKNNRNILIYNLPPDE